MSDDSRILTVSRLEPKEGENDCGWPSEVEKTPKEVPICLNIDIKIKFKNLRLHFLLLLHFFGLS